MDLTSKTHGFYRISFLYSISMEFFYPTVKKFTRQATFFVPFFVFMLRATMDFQRIVVVEKQ